MRLEKLVIEVYAATWPITKHVDSDDAEVVHQLLIDLIYVAGICTKTMEHHKCRLTVLLTFSIIELENFLVTHDEGPNLNYFPATEAEMDVFANYVLIRHLA